jgi:lathosterol oxidase
MSDIQGDRRSGWNHQPETLPLAVSPVLNWPPRPIAWLRWIFRYWIAVSPVTLQFAAAWAIFAWLMRDPASMRSLSGDWVAQIWLRNLLLLMLVAGGLHLWFYTLGGQGKRLKFDTRDFSRKDRRFRFGDQVLDNMLWSLGSGVTVWTGFEVLYWWAGANGYAPGLLWVGNPVWFVLWFALIPIWASMHFYWIHRGLHWPPLYRLAHALHHRNVNIGPWSGIAMHPVEHLFYFSSLLIHFAVPSHPAHVLFHFLVLALNPAFSHSGYEGVETGGRKRLTTGDFFHQLHHRYFECNYGTAEVPWDRLFGSFHNGTDEGRLAVRRAKRSGRDPGARN